MQKTQEKKIQKSFFWSYNIDMDKDKEIVLITGASSGIGLEVALKLLNKGYTVYGAARRTELMKPIQESGGNIIPLDFYDEKSISSTINTIIQKEGHIDVLINNAGFGLGGAIETVSMEDAKKQFEVNVFGLAKITQQVLPYMREQKKGRIINISSIAGLFSTPFMGWYHASKYSVEALSDALRLEVLPFNIKVSLIEPGFIKTDWGKIAADSILKSSEGTAYAEKGEKISSYYRKTYCQKKKITPPSSVADIIIKSVTTKNPKTRYRVGKCSGFFTTISRLLPTKILDTYKIKEYGINGD